MMTYFFLYQIASYYSLMVKTGDYQCMGLLKRWFKTSERPKKSPFKMEFYTEPQSQCKICDYGWFKTSERLKKVHSK